MRDRFDVTLWPGRMQEPATQPCQFALIGRLLALFLGLHMHGICHCGGVMLCQAPSRPGSHGLHGLSSTSGTSTLCYSYLHLFSSVSMTPFDSLFAGRPCMPAAASYAGSRGVTMSPPPNAQCPCLAKPTNVLIVASLPDLLSCGPSADSIFASPFVPQVLLAAHYVPTIDIIHCSIRHTAQRRCH